MLRTKLSFASLAVAVLALGGCDDAAQTSAPSEPRVEENDPAADFELAEFRAVGRDINKPSSCELSAQCGRSSSAEGASAESCREATQRCMQELASRTAGIVRGLGTCRQEAIACVRSGKDRDACRESFSACSKGAVEDAPEAEAPEAEVPETPDAADAP